MVEASAIPQEVAEVLEKGTTDMVIDALAIMGLDGGIRGLRPSRGCEDAKILARVTTVLFGAPRADSQRLNMYQSIRDRPSGSLLVIDGKGIEAHFTGDNQRDCVKRRHCSS